MGALVYEPAFNSAEDRDFSVSLDVMIMGRIFPTSWITRETGGLPHRHFTSAAQGKARAAD